MPARKILSKKRISPKKLSSKKMSPKKMRSRKLLSKQTPTKQMPSTMIPSKIPSPCQFTFPFADVRLLITYEGVPAYAHVNSNAMCLASPVWKNFIFPPWKADVDVAPGKDHGGKRKREQNEMEPVEELDFSDDNADLWWGALHMLLRVAHNSLSKDLIQRPDPIIPRKQLVNMAILCNKYICTDILEPWVVRWTAYTWHYDYHEYLNDNPSEVREMMLVGFVFRARNYHFFEAGAWWIYQHGNKSKFRGFPENWPLPDSIVGE
jgi:hypothetical protein